jgi:capsular polysaccharide export protein
MPLLLASFLQRTKDLILMTQTPIGSSVQKRSFLFLQGPTSTVFRDLGRALAQRGHRVLRVNVCPGDWLMWRGQDTVWFRGSLAEWPDYLSRLIATQDATDIVYFADRFPYHKAAQRVARAHGVRSVAMEYGYLRPDWLILEEGGQSTYSHFPDDPAILTQAAQGLASVPTGREHAIPALTEVFCEAGFHLSNVAFGWLSPRYGPDRYYPVLREFPAYLPRFIARARNAEPAQKVVDRLAAAQVPCFLVPLQMQNDYQLRDNAPPGYQAGFIAEIIASFKVAALPDARLIFKLHPMDNGLEKWPSRIEQMAQEIGIAGRVDVIDGGDLAQIFGFVAGCVVINSTTGLQALRAGVPTRVCGVAVYDIKGLTHQGKLDAFWQAPTPPNPELLEAFIRSIGHAIHVRGTVYGASGRAAFVQNAIARLEAPQLHAAGLHVARPPRIAKARALGIRVDWPAEPVAA